MLKFDVITLFPQLFTQHLKNLPFRKAVELGLLEVNLHNLRDFAIDKHGTVDDRPYGGGVGMILMVEPIFKALESLGKTENGKKGRVVVLSPSGQKYDQKLAQEFSKEKEITLVCGRYEGIDHRVMEHLATDVISIGDYVVSGGETPALVIMESVTRLLPGVLEKEAALESESFLKEGTVEHPQYTRPEDFKGWKVPKVLLSGNHKEIEKWKGENSC